MSDSDRVKPDRTLDEVRTQFLELQREVGTLATEALHLRPTWRLVLRAVAPPPPPPIPPETVSRSAEAGVTVRAVRLSSPLRVDGKLDESVYAEVPAIDGLSESLVPHKRRRNGDRRTLSARILRSNEAQEGRGRSAVRPFPVTPP